MNAIIALIIALAIATTFQFYRGRKLNLLLMEQYLNEIESVFNPKEKDYVWLGGYVGYKATYGKIHTTLTLLPRQSLLYLPISLITSRHDKLYVVIKLNKPLNETHLIQKRYYRIKPKIFLKHKSVQINNTEFECFYSDKKTSELLIDVVNSMPKPKNIKHIGISDSVYVLMKPEPKIVAESLKVLVNKFRIEI